MAWSNWLKQNVLNKNGSIIFVLRALILLNYLLFYSDVSDIRFNTQSPQFASAVSLSFYNGVLFWTTPSSVVTEEYNSAADSYFQNSFDVPKSLQPLGAITMLHPDSQPLPVPMAPPQQLQVLYAQTKARITWRPPPPISALGNVILDTVVELNLILPRAYYHFPLQ
jgi:hypothetical protein